MFDFDDGGLGGLGGGELGMGGLGMGGSGRGIRAQPAPPKVPVTILCGFLGAGKTTLVRHILRNREGMKVGVVVNDIAETNIDSEILKFEDADGIVGLQNGCVCCSGRDDLFARLKELVESNGVSKLDRPWDRLVVECSGVAEPESIAKELEAMGRRGEPIMRRIFLAGIVCVVDAATFWESYTSDDVGVDHRVPLSVLLVNQVESADTVIVTKPDLVDQAQAQRVDQLLATLAPTARRRVVSKGEIPLRELLPADPVGLEMPAYVPTLANRHSTSVRSAGKSFPATSTTASSPADAGHASHGRGEHAQSGHGDGHGHSSHGHGHGHSAHGGGHGHSHGEDHDPSSCSVCAAESLQVRHARYGLSSFVYRRDGRFDATSLASAVRALPGVAVAAVDLPPPSRAEEAGAAAPPDAFRGVMRSKGFVRVAGSDKTFYWSHAGRQIQVAEADGAPTVTAKGPTQEVVFIGAGMDQDAVTAALDSCLVAPSAAAAL